MVLAEEFADVVEIRPGRRVFVLRVVSSIDSIRTGQPI